MEDRVVAHTLVHKRNVNCGWQLLIDAEELLHQIRPLVLQPDESIRDLAQSLNEGRRRQITVVYRLINLLLLQDGVLLRVDELLLLFDRLHDVGASALVDFITREPVLERWQVNIFRRDLSQLVVLLELLDLSFLDQAAVVLADIIVDAVVNLLERLLLVPPLEVVLVDHVLHAGKPLLLPLTDLSRQFIAAVV